MSTMASYDIVIIGAGPGGFTAAISASQLGYRVALVDSRDKLGGTCLNEGCIPSKCLLNDTELLTEAKKSFRNHGVLCDNVSADLAIMSKRKSQVINDLASGMKKSCDALGVTVYCGTASFVSNNEVSVKNAETEETFILQANTGIVIAVGGKSSSLPSLPFDGTEVLSSKEILELSSVPTSMVCIGSGAIGLELGCILLRLGTKITVVEYLPQILPAADAEISAGITRILQRQGIRFYTNSNVISRESQDGLIHLTMEDNTTKQTTDLTTEKILVSVGRVPATSALGVEKLGMSLTKRGQIIVDNRFRSSISNIWAIGDVIEGPMLAHKAEYDAKLWAKTLVDDEYTFDQKAEYSHIPSVVYSSPEVASVGLTETQARVQYFDKIKIGKSAYVTIGRAKAMGIRDGFVKVISDNNGTLLGLHILGNGADAHINLGGLVLQQKGTVMDLDRMVFPHPSISEVLKDACHDLLSQLTKH